MKDAFSMRADDGAVTPRIRCPAPLCGADNDGRAQLCVACLTPLAGYARLMLYPNVLFNRGLRAARAGDPAAARDLFAAVVHWLPRDLQARNAHALACLDGGDRDGARRGWEEVLAIAPRDLLAARGLTALESMPPAPRAKRRSKRTAHGRAKAAPPPGAQTKRTGAAKAEPERHSTARPKGAKPAARAKPQAAPPRPAKPPEPG
jgi:hypothetical protein